MPSLGTLESGKTGGEGRLKAWVDGAAVWDTSVPFFGATSGTVSVGRNSSGCDSVSAELSSVVVDLRQVP
jgi:hypothetical protein